MDALKPQDVVVLLKLVSHGTGEWTYESLSEALGLSASQVHRSLARGAGAGLYDAASRRVHRRNLSEFLVHGVRYAFPAALGARSRGVPTGHSAGALSSKLAGAGSVPLVWPSGAGTLVGDSVTPLHDCVVQSVARDESLHEMLALVDAVRVGSARERSIASTLLAERLA